MEALPVDVDGDAEDEEFDAQAAPASMQSASGIWRVRRKSDAPLLIEGQNI
jgi:hypothetical protein